MIHENRLVTSLTSHRSYESLRESIQQALGIAWDDELEGYRRESSEYDLDKRSII